MWRRTSPRLRRAGPRYDSGLLPEERGGAANAIWLCQTCGRLVDADIVQFSADTLRRWKFDAEIEARSRVGKTQTAVGNATSKLAVWTKVKIEPAIPRYVEGQTWTVTGDEGGSISLKKDDSLATVTIPKSLIEGVHTFDSDGYSLVQLSCRLQWVTTKQRWEVLSQKPSSNRDGQYGVSKDVDFHYPKISGYVGRFTVRWFRDDRVPTFLGQGWNVFYEDDGSYLRVRGPDVDQILLLKVP